MRAIARQGRRQAMSDDEGLKTVGVSEELAYAAADGAEDLKRALEKGTFSVPSLPKFHFEDIMKCVRDLEKLNPPRLDGTYVLPAKEGESFFDARFRKMGEQIKAGIDRAVEETLLKDGKFHAKIDVPVFPRPETCEAMRRLVRELQSTEVAYGNVIANVGDFLHAEDEGTDVAAAKKCPYCDEEHEMLAYVCSLFEEAGISFVDEPRKDAICQLAVTLDAYATDVETLTEELDELELKVANQNEELAYFKAEVGRLQTRLMNAMQIPADVLAKAATTEIKIEMSPEASPEAIRKELAELTKDEFYVVPPGELTAQRTYTINHGYREDRDLVSIVVNDKTPPTTIKRDFRDVGEAGKKIAALTRYEPELRNGKTVYVEKELPIEVECCEPVEQTEPPRIDAPSERFAAQAAVLRAEFDRPNVPRRGPDPFKR